MEAPIPYDNNGNYSLPNGYLAVTGQKILASQHNPPLEDIRAALSQVLLRTGVAPMTGPLNLNGFKVTGLLDGTASTDAVTYAQLQDALSRITNLAPVGSVKAFRRKTAPTGWVKENGGTIGNPASGATTRANADTIDLFTLLWTEFTNAELPITTNVGAPSTRGASAAADFAANKRMTLFDSRTRFLRGSDDGLAYDATLTVGTAQDDALKAHKHAVPPHAHPIPSRSRDGYGSEPGGTRVASTNGNNFSGTVADAYATSNSAAFDTADTGIALETRPRASVVLYCIKL
jgi:hypothetical protein